ncbi:tripartite tricarboxylate transporter substrate binding protein [Neorhizobium sp. Rsf11]|uniref:Tripartite tricarboxylate transporter substrate binding protein n=2 Tax=Neorhizobium TaxID=1525371 RepID=A0ABV0LX97_9HYPH|nr:tripartite tricarboxylate transporter substrate binding protein [Neorhizobium petrolearium]MCC2611243.1 tripartite tricarboxylate transporter substrate binding protein [Neorhizobium petrolearium]WGI66447.1 tripartite tricarboxylate transporter substrate binding protein [Neorhizobium petrolearium]
MVVWTTGMKNGLVAAAIALASAVGVSAEEQYPVSTVRMIVPYAPGGGGDITGRMIAEEISKRLKTTVVVENIGGASGTIGTEKAARAKPDGATLLLAGSAIFTTAPHLTQIGFDPLKDFVAIANISESVRMLSVPPELGVKTYEELVAYGKANPGILNYASVGVGSTGHIIGVDFLRSAGVEARHIPYSGASQAVQALLSGDVQFVIDAMVIPPTREGKLVPIAVPSETRLADFPDVPTFREVGLKDVRTGGWQAVMAPAGTPQELVTMIEGALKDADESQEFRAALTRAGFSPRFRTGVQLQQELEAEYAYFGSLLKSMDISKK